MSDARISVKVSKDFRKKLKAALSLKETDLTKWVKTVGQKEIDAAESCKEPLATNLQQG